MKTLAALFTVLALNSVFAPLAQAQTADAEMTRFAQRIQPRLEQAVRARHAAVYREYQAGIAAEVTCRRFQYGEVICQVRDQRFKTEDGVEGSVGIRMIFGIYEGTTRQIRVLHSSTQLAG